MTIHGVPPHRGQVVDDGPIDQFIRTLSSLSAEEWQRRIESLQTLVNSTPDYSTTYSNNNSNDSDDDALNNTANSNTTTIIPWYRSSKSVRRLASPLKTLLLDARSAVVKEATELIGVLLSVKLQCHPSFTVAIMAEENNKEENDDDEKKNEDKQGREDDDDDDVFNNTSTTTTTPTKQPPPFVGRLLFKDLLPSILQLSSQTVKVIRTYGITMTLQIIPHCRVKSALIILLERMKSDKNRNVREDCARYLRCVLETWPVDKNMMMEEAVVEGGSNENTAGIGHNTNTRTEEQLTYETIQQIGMGLGRALTDPAQPVRNETKRGFQVVFQRYRPVWNEVMNSGIIRDVRLRKNLLEAASRSGEDNNGTLLLFDDMASLGDLSLNTSTSFTSMRSNTSYRSYASRGLGVGGGGGSASVGGGGGGRAVPSVIGTPKVTRKYGVSSSRYSPSASTSSPSYTRTTTSSSGSKIRNKESSSTFSSSTYVLSSGHVVSSSSSTPQRTSRLPPPSPSSTPQRTSRLPSSSSPRKSSMTPPKQPFASLMQTPQPNQNETTPTRSYTNNAIRQSPKSAKMLRKRLSRRISGIDALEAAAAATTTTTTTNGPEEYKRQLSSIAEKNDDGNITSTTSPLSATNNNMNSNTDEITYVALEVISAHLAHLDKIENQVSREKDLLLDLNKQLGISISDATNSDELAQCLNKLTEEQVCDYFEAVHICVDLQRNASESLLREMERISQGGGGGDLSMNSSDVMDTTSADGSSNGVMDGLPQSPLSSKNSNGLERVQRDLGAQF